MNDTPTLHPVTQPRNPLRGVTREAMASALLEHYGWNELARTFHRN